MNDNSLFSCSFLLVCRTDSKYTSEDSLHSRHAMACRALMTSAIFLLITAVLVDSHLALAQQPTASNDNCFLITIANLPAQTSPIEACLQLGLTNIPKYTWYWQFGVININAEPRYSAMSLRNYTNTIRDRNTANTLYVHIIKKEKTSRHPRAY